MARARTAGAIATLPDKFLRNHATTMRLPRRTNALFLITPNTLHPNTVGILHFHEVVSKQQTVKKLSQCARARTGTALAIASTTPLDERSSRMRLACFHEWWPPRWRPVV